MNKFFKGLLIGLSVVLLGTTAFGAYKRANPSEIVFKAIKATLNGTTTGVKFFEASGGYVGDGLGNRFLTGGSLGNYVDISMTGDWNDAYTWIQSFSGDALYFTNNSGDYLLVANSGTYYDLNPAGYITGAALSPYLLLANSGDYYTANPLGYITGGALNGYLTGYTETDPIWNSVSGNYIPVSGQIPNDINRDLWDGSHRSNIYITNINNAIYTGFYFSRDNYLGEIFKVTAQNVRMPQNTGFDCLATDGNGQIISGDCVSTAQLTGALSGYLTGFTESDPIFMQNSGDFYLATNPEGYITGVDLSGYLTGDLYRQDVSSELLPIISGQTIKTQLGASSIAMSVSPIDVVLGGFPMTLEAGTIGGTMDVPGFGALPLVRALGNMFITEVPGAPFKPGFSLTNFSGNYGWFAQYDVGGGDSFELRYVSGDLMSQNLLFQVVPDGRAKAGFDISPLIVDPEDYITLAYLSGQGYITGTNTIFQNSGNVTSNAGGTYGFDNFVFGSPTLDMTTYANRMFYNTSKGAFRAGVGLAGYWDDSNVGMYSIAMGINPIANSQGAISIGANNISSGNNAVSIGADTYALKDNSMSLGFGNSVDSMGTFSMGVFNNISDESPNSMALGHTNLFTNESEFSYALGDSNTINDAEGSVAIGDRNQIDTVERGYALGFQNEIRSNYSVGIGYFNSFVGGAIYSNAMGSQNTIYGSNSITLGVSNTTNAPYSLNAGYRNTTNGIYSAILGGYDNVTSGQAAVAFGESNDALSNFAIAGGNAMTASGVAAIALGKSGVALGDGAINIGTNNASNEGDTITIGTDNISSLNFATAIGTRNNAVSPYTMALGRDIDLTAQYAVGIGTNADANAIYATSIGHDTLAAGSNSTAIGYDVEANGQESMALGYQTTAQGINDYAFGSNSNASGGYSMALGYQANANGRMSYAFGHDIASYGVNSMTLGFLSETNGTGAMAIGTEANANGEYSMAIGKLLTASGITNILIGNNSTTDGESALSIGTYNTVNGLFSTAIGYGAELLGNDSTAIGSASKAIGNQAVGIGYSSRAEALQATAIGTYNVASGSKSVAIGNNIASYVTGTIGIGNYIYGNSPFGFNVGRYNLGLTNSIFELGFGTGTSNKANAITVLNDGNMGIGDDTPTQKLTVAGNVKTYGVLYKSGSLALPATADEGDSYVGNSGGKHQIYVRSGGLWDLQYSTP